PSRRSPPSPQFYPHLGPVSDRCRTLVRRRKWAVAVSLLTPDADGQELRTTARGSTSYGRHAEPNFCSAFPYVTAPPRLRTQRQHPRDSPWTQPADALRRRCGL